MKVLFVIQGEGRGHLTQAMTMEHILRAHGHEVVGMLVGKSKARTLPAFFTEGVKAPVHHYETINFVPSHRNKRPSAVRTFFGNLALSAKFWSSVRLIKRTIRSSGADLVLNFYEILGTFGYLKSGRKVPMVCIGHQFLFLSRSFSFPEFGFEGSVGLNVFSWAICKPAAAVLALSFRDMPGDSGLHLTVVPPLLRPEVLNLRGEDGHDSPDFRKGDYILGYMLNSGFAREVEKWHSRHPDVPLRFFWDKADEGKVKVVDDTLRFYYLDDKEFVRQMAGCGAYASTAGFESICEAMYLGKPLMMVPAHIEQKCNAYDATRDGAAVECDRFDLSVLVDFQRNGFRPDEGFPAWARSAETRIVAALEKTMEDWGKKKSKNIWISKR